MIINIFQFIHNYSKLLYKDAIPDEEVAIQYTELVLVSMFDVDLSEYRPFTVEFNKYKQAWVVISTLPEGYLGKPSVFVIRKKDGKIMKIE
jgi:uncharacterized membrane-anchored protein